MPLRMSHAPDAGSTDWVLPDFLPVVNRIIMILDSPFLGVPLPGAYVGTSCYGERIRMPNLLAPRSGQRGELDTAP
jgi:hypothetical protein